ncbi:hypothetical protein [Thioclava sp. IC9]|uniref:hypothetical protein n=1 Tax=Thioclava sp. IC9 TaxID=1973007 RepID=UPI00113081AE|nr:hypothetical protein [Thioclava sp. IC9]
MNKVESSTLAEKKFGWPLPSRRQAFSDLTKEALEKRVDSHRIENFKGKTISLPILRVEIGLPKYRIANGRTSSIQEEWVVTKGVDESFFTGGDPELYTLQEAQHEILCEMIGEEGLSEKFRDPNNKQVEPLLLDESGFVINGNRRLCSWRNLYYSDQKKYSHFSHVDVVVLPKCEEKELDAIESRLQIEKDIRSDYTWHAEAKMFKEKQRKFGYTTSELSRQYRKTKKDIEELFEIRDLGSEYLSARGKKNMWSLLNETEHTFKRLNKAMKEQKSLADREVLKEIAFHYIDDPDAAEERLYTFIPKLGKHLSSVKSELRMEFSGADAKEIDDQALQAFGGGDSSSTEASDMNLVANVFASPADISKAQDIIVETLKAEKEKVGEEAKAKYFLKQLHKTRSALNDALNLGLTPEAEIEGAEKQLDAIEASIVRIREFIKQRKK